MNKLITVFSGFSLQVVWIIVIIVFFLPVGGIAVHAALPGEASVQGIDKQGVREGYSLMLRYDYDSREVFNPYLIESINAALPADSGVATLSVDRYADSTAGIVLKALEETGAAVYVMDELQGRTLKTLVAGGIPVLLLGKKRNMARSLSRIHADILYAYRDPDFMQSSRLSARDRKYVFKTVRGFELLGSDLHKPASSERDDEWLLQLQAGDPIEQVLHYAKSVEYRMELSPLKREPFNVFDSFCVVTAPGRTLEDVKKVINDGLADVGFEYKLPEFKRLTASMLE